MDEIEEMLKSNSIDLSKIELDKPTICTPDDAYYVFQNHPEVCSMFGIYTLKDVDSFVKKIYKPEFWPKHLKED